MHDHKNVQQSTPCMSSRTSSETPHILPYAPYFTVRACEPVCQAHLCVSMPCSLVPPHYACPLMPSCIHVHACACSQPTPTPVPMPQPVLTDITLLYAYAWSKLDYSNYDV